VLPNPHVLLTRRFNSTNPGPFPALRSISDWPTAGILSNRPYGVATTSVPALLAIPGRAVAATCPVKYKSVPVVMLNGIPLCATKNGDTRTFQGAVNEPPRNSELRTSSAERPYSCEKSYWFAGSVARPSVSPCAIPYAYLLNNVPHLPIELFTLTFTCVCLKVPVD
jgi:hypothetical protein